MSSATAPLAAGFTLTGTTFARDTAPVFYEISGPSFGQAIGEQYDLRALRNVYQKTAADGKIEVYIDNLLLKRFDTSGEAASVIASITQAVVAIDRSIQQQATTAAPAPKPTPTPPPATKPANTNITTNTTTSNVQVTANTVTKTTVTNTTNTTATARANTTVTSNSVTKTTVTNVTNTSGGSKTVVTAPKKPVANTADVQTVTTVSDLPIKIVTDPITVDVPTFNRSGNVTGNTQVTLKLDPVTINDEPIAVSNLDPGELGSALVNSDELDAIAAQAGADGAAAIAAAEEELRVAAADQDQFVFQGRKDWRVRLSLSDAPEVNYLYRAPNPGILNPLNATNGVLFPYTPTISVNYTASYNPTELVHSNYKVFQYSSSSGSARRRSVHALSTTRAARKAA